MYPTAGVVVRVYVASPAKREEAGFPVRGGGSNFREADTSDVNLVMKPDEGSLVDDTLCLLGCHEAL